MSRVLIIFAVVVVSCSTGVVSSHADVRDSLVAEYIWAKEKAQWACLLDPKIECEGFFDPRFFGRPIPGRLLRDPEPTDVNDQIVRTIESGSVSYDLERVAIWVCEEQAQAIYLVTWNALDKDGQKMKGASMISHQWIRKGGDWRLAPRK